MAGASDAWLVDMVAGGMLGRKAGRGFYLYDPPGTKPARGAAAGLLGSVTCAGRCGGGER